MAFLLDTNILLRMIDLKHPMNQDVTNAIKVLRSQNEQLFIIPQNLIEFWNVCTRPLEKNGLGMTVSETEREISRMENLFIVLPDQSDIYPLMLMILDAFLKLQLLIPQILIKMPMRIK